MTRLMTRALSASVLAHVATGIAVVRLGYGGALRPADSAAAPVESVLVIEAAADEVRPATASAADQSVSGAGVTTDVRENNASELPVPARVSTPPAVPAPMPVVTPVPLSAPLLASLPTLPDRVEPVSAGLVSVVPLPAVDAREPVAIAAAPTSAGSPSSAPGESVARVDNVPGLERGSARPGRGRGPAYRRNPLPDYPPEAVANRWEGTVLLEVILDSDGHPGSVRVQQSSGHKALDASAVRAARLWDFEPARVNGRTIRATVEVPIRFYLADLAGRRTP